MATGGVPENVLPRSKSSIKLALLSSLVAGYLWPEL
jgi:hypothetical protein